MKITLKNFGIKDVSALFYVSNRKDLEDILDKARLVSRKSYMQGYYLLDDDNIKISHKFLAKLYDVLVKMYINRIELDS